jgi:hypothetical protein
MPPSTTPPCTFCRRSEKPTQPCDLCQEPVCKDCQELLTPETFAFLPEPKPKELTLNRYCPGCFDTHVQPAQTQYEETLETAKQAYFFFKTQKAQLPITKRAQTPLKIESCPDRDETILRLAFLAIREGYNSIVDAEVTSEKVRNEGYQTSRWRGVGTPATVDTEKLERRSMKPGQRPRE